MVSMVLFFKRDKGAAQGRQMWGASRIEPLTRRKIGAPGLRGAIHRSRDVEAHHLPSISTVELSSCTTVSRPFSSQFCQISNCFCRAVFARENIFLVICGNPLIRRIRAIRWAWLSVEPKVLVGKTVRVPQGTEHGPGKIKWIGLLFFCLLVLPLEFGRS